MAGLGTDEVHIVEDEEASAPLVKRQGFGAPAESCPPMKSLVQRKPGKGGGRKGC